jgi:hypothetical protein
MFFLLCNFQIKLLFYLFYTHLISYIFKWARKFLTKKILIRKVKLATQHELYKYEWIKFLRFTSTHFYQRWFSMCHPHFCVVCFDRIDALHALIPSLMFSLSSFQFYRRVVDDKNSWRWLLWSNTKREWERTRRKIDKRDEEQLEKWP